MEQAESYQYDDGFDQSTSPLESVDSNTTPGTEYSPPFSPIPKSAVVDDARLVARAKLARLSLEEKVGALHPVAGNGRLTPQGFPPHGGGFLEDEGDTFEGNPGYQDE